jgi:2-keto-4-pentenoate hydratase/2-oxohepta-3-ene-1,7-dioic acid hydratase in catechol pathway
VARLIQMVAEDGRVRPGIVRDDGEIIDGAGSAIGALDESVLAAPCTPTKIIGVGRNYRSHLDERGQAYPTEPWVFLKAPNAVVGHRAEIIRPPGVDRIDYEAELALVVSRRASRIASRNWRQHVLGVTNANDVTVRAWQEGNAQWWRAKSSDTLCPLGPWIDTDIDLDASVPIRAWVDGELRQDGATDDLLFGFGEILEFVTRTMTLEPGDVILTGSPSGAGPVDVGATVEVEVAGIGRLINHVVEAA